MADDPPGPRFAGVKSKETHLPPAQTRDAGESALRKQLADVLEGLQPAPSGKFSPAAFEELKGTLVEFTSDLVSHAKQLARRQKSDIVSKTNVIHASRNLGPISPNVVARRIGIVGTLFFGAAVPELVKSIGTGTAPEAFWMVPAILGAAMMVYSWGK